MSAALADRIAEQVTALRRSHPRASARDVLDLVLAGEAAREVSALPAESLHPRAPLGQLIVEAFDGGMTPAEWYDWTGPNANPAMSAALLPIWRMYVLPRFTARYGISGAPL